MPVLGLTKCNASGVTCFHCALRFNIDSALGAGCLLLVVKTPKLRVQPYGLVFTCIIFLCGQSVQFSLPVFYGFWGYGLCLLGVSKAFFCPSICGFCTLKRPHIEFTMMPCVCAKGIFCMAEGRFMAVSNSVSAFRADIFLMTHCYMYGLKHRHHVSRHFSAAKSFWGEV